MYPSPLLAAPGGGGDPLHFFSSNSVTFCWESYNSLCLLKIFVTGTQQRKNDFLLATEDFVIWHLLLAVNVYCQVSIYVNFNYSILSIAKVLKKMNRVACIFNSFNRVFPYFPWIGLQAQEREGARGPCVLFQGGGSQQC